MSSGSVIHPVTATADDVPFTNRRARNNAAGAIACCPPPCTSRTRWRSSPAPVGAQAVTGGVPVAERLSAPTRRAPRARSPRPARSRVPPRKRSLPRRSRSAPSWPPGRREPGRGTRPTGAPARRLTSRHAIPRLVRPPRHRRLRRTSVGLRREPGSEQPLRQHGPRHEARAPRADDLDVRMIERLERRTVPLVDRVQPELDHLELVRHADQGRTRREPRLERESAEAASR